MSEPRTPAFFRDFSEDALFDEILADLFLRRDATLIAPTVTFLTHHLNLQLGHTVFDQCCGIGSLSIPLAQQGMQVIGVDLCASYIQQARQLKSSCQFHQGDAHSVVPDVECDAAFNWFTSFGFAEDAVNLQMLSCAFRSLKSGARFALDFPNMAHLLRAFQPSDIHEHELPDGKAYLIREGSLDLRQGTLEQQWTLILPSGERRVKRSQLRLYLPHQLIGMLEQSGFIEIEVFGGIESESLHLDSRRCICLARKP